MYSLRDYGAMIADAGRSNAYAKAIARAVRPGDTVADIGCGPGVFSLLACRAGARRVSLSSQKAVFSSHERMSDATLTMRVNSHNCDTGLCSLLLIRKYGNTILKLECLPRISKVIGKFFLRQDCNKQLWITRQHK